MSVYTVEIQASRISTNNAYFVVTSQNQSESGYVIVYENNADVGHSQTVTVAQSSIEVQVTGLAADTTYEAVFWSTTDSMEVSERITFETSKVSRSMIMYGPVNSLTTLVDKMYGSKRGRGRSISKIYGSENGVTKLVYLGLGEIPRPGSLTYYTDSSHTTTATIPIVTQANVDALHNPGTSGNWDIVIDSVTINNLDVKEVVLPSWVTTLGNRFLNACRALDTFNLPPSVTTIGNNFLADCDIFNDTIDLFYVESFGYGFMRGCPAFNQALDISKFTELPNYFLYNAQSFNQPLDTSNIRTIGNEVLLHAQVFNQPLDLSSLETVGYSFLSNAIAFNQPITIPSSVTSIGVGFLRECRSMISIITCNAPASVAESSNNTFGTESSTADSYVIGTKLGGRYATEWIAKFPTRDTSPYRNVGYGDVPILVETSASSQTLGISEVVYGVSSWDMTGTYTSGTVTLYRGTSSNPNTQIDTYSAVGQTVYSDTELNGNTKYYYKVLATNNGNKTAQEEITYTTVPETLNVSVADVGYETYNTFKRAFTLGIPANGGALEQTISYRLKKYSDSDFGDWINIGTYNSTQSGSLVLDVIFETGTEYEIEFRALTSAGSSVASYKQALIPEHQGPTGVAFTLDDANTSVQDWLETFDGYTQNMWYISGKSQPRVTITNAGQTTDSATLIEYEATITRPENGYSSVITYSSVSPMTYTFPEESIADTQNAGLITTKLEARDSLQAINNFYQGGMYMTWAKPTFNATAQRTGRIGQLRLSFNGTYSGLQADALNHGQDLNKIEVEYRVLDYTSEVITDWTTVDDSDIDITSLGNTALDRSYQGVIRIVNFQYTKSVIVEIRASDHFGLAGSTGIQLDLWSEEQKLKPVEYEIEVWDWKTNTFVADISTLVAGDLSINWELNDIEEIDFSIDMVQFEERCQDMGVEPKDILTPYKHDIRIRRNGEYIVGAQLVEANIQIPNNSPVLINIKCTGFLNLFKDQYILDEAWSGYTYAQIARKLVQAAQKPDCLIKNPTADIDTSYWLAPNGTMSSSLNAYSGDRCIMVSRSGTGWMTAATQMSTDSGQSIIIDAWVKGQSGRRLQIVEREYSTQSNNQVEVTTFTLDGNWQHVQTSYTTFWENGYILFEYNRDNSSSVLYVDDCYIYAQNDDAALCNLNVSLGVDTASDIQQDIRQVDYSLQNVKDAIVDLVSMEDDNFDFDFSYDRTFNCYARKGEEKLNVGITYPGNVETINIGRSAANLVNKIYRIGSGIGDERLQVDVMNNASREIYGTRESIVTQSNVELESTLLAQAVGDLYDRKDPTDLPTVTIRDGSVNPSIVQVGDSVPVEIQGNEYLGTINDVYRIIKISLTVSEDAVENMKLSLEPPVKRPEKKMVRYIRDSLTGNDKDLSKRWSEIQALMLVGNEFTNVAQGATVYGSSSFSSGHGGSLATDGNQSTYANMVASSDRRAITIDLGAEYPIDYIKVWHYPDGRIMYGEHLSVGTELPDGTDGIEDLETVLWAYTDGAGYVETSTGKRSGWIQENKVTNNTSEDSVHMIRYIRESHKGNSNNTSNMWSEIMAWMNLYDNPKSNLLAKATKIFYSDSMANAEDGIRAPIDRDTETFASTSADFPAKRRSVTVDLGGLYPIDYVKIYNYRTGNSGDLGRTPYGSHLSVGTTLPGEANGIEDLETVLWADEENSGVPFRDGRTSSWLQGLPNNVSNENPTMVRYIKDTYLRSSTNNTKSWRRFSVYMRDAETGTYKDLAAGKAPIPTSNNMVNPLTNATDSIESTVTYTEETGYQSLVIDLGAEYPIDYIRIKHHDDNRITYGNRLSVGTELTEGNEPLETIVWDDGETIGYVEHDVGRWSGWIQDNPQRTFTTGTRRPIRYIRDSIVGNNKNNGNHWVEIEAYIYGNQTWDNVAYGKTVTCSFTSTVSGHSNPQIVTNGNTDTDDWLGMNETNPATKGAVTVDLGQNYYVDYIRVRHYFGDGRIYNSPVLSVGTSLPEGDNGKDALETVIWDDQYTERACGRISPWLQGELDG